jgi:uncharacterized repeat protein (TIGR02543 family)
MKYIHLGRHKIKWITLLSFMILSVVNASLKQPTPTALQSEEAVSSNPARWSNIGLYGENINCLAISSSDPNVIFAGTPSGLAKTDDMGNSWHYSDDLLFPIGAVSISNQDPLTILAGEKYQGSCGTWETNYYSFHRSRDGGQSWEEYNVAYLYAWCGSTLLTEILIDEYDSNLILVGTTFRTMGMSFVAWTNYDEGIWDGSFDYSCNALAVDPNDHNIVYIGEQSGSVFRYTDIWGNWNRERIKRYSYEDIRDIEADINSQVYLATDEGIKKWDGSVWTILAGLPTDNITSLAIDKDEYPGTIYAGTGGDGVFISQDGGETWSPFSEDLGNLNITKLALSKTQPRLLYAGTKNGGVWSIDVSSFSTCKLRIEVSSGGITEPSPGSYDYDCGTEVTVTAVPDSGYRFNGWTGDFPLGHENDNPLTITVDSDKSITANFLRLYTLTIAAGSGGTTDPSAGNYTFDTGTEVTIDAIHDTGFEFNGWTGNVPSGHENDNPLTITMNGDKTIAANFIRLQYTLTISSGSGGTTEPSPGTYTYDYGTNVTVSAIADSGYQFDGWSGDATGTSSAITITIDTDKSITARFKEIPPTPPPNGQGGACFIATAAYGSPLHPHLDILRDFRDRNLMPSKLGRMLVECYYKYSPAVADLIAEHKALKWMVRVGLLPLVGFSYSLLRLGPVITSVIPILLRFN